MLVHVGPGLLRVPGEAQFVHNYIVTTQGGFVELPGGSEIGGCPHFPVPISPPISVSVPLFALLPRHD